MGGREGEEGPGHNRCCKNPRFSFYCLLFFETEMYTHPGGTYIPRYIQYSTGSLSVFARPVTRHVFGEEGGGWGYYVFFYLVILLSDLIVPAMRKRGGDRTVDRGLGPSLPFLFVFSPLSSYTPHRFLIHAHMHGERSGGEEGEEGGGAKCPPVVVFIRQFPISILPKLVRCFFRLWPLFISYHIGTYTEPSQPFLPCLGPLPDRTMMFLIYHLK